MTTSSDSDSTHAFDEQIVEELRAMRLNGSDIWQLAQFVTRATDGKPLTLAHYFSRAFECGGLALVRFVNSYSQGTASAELAEELANQLPKAERGQK